VKALGSSCCFLAVLSLISSWPSLVTAADPHEIEITYGRLNARLLELNLAEPIKLIDEGKEAQAERILLSIDLDSIKHYYTNAQQLDQARCWSNAICRISNLIALNIQTMKEYRVVSLEERDGNRARLVLVGTNMPGLQRKIVVMWLLESGAWKINGLSIGPP